MSLEQLSSIGELVGGIGVLATLLFLVFEIRNNSRILKANAKTAGMESFASYNELIATDPYLPPLIGKVLRKGFGSLDTDEHFRVTAAIRALVQRMEAQYFQYTEGLVDPVFWSQRRIWLKGFLSNPGFIEWWELESRSAQVTDEFVLHINSTDSEVIIGINGQLVEDT